MSLETRRKGGDWDALPLAQRGAKSSRYNVSDNFFLLLFVSMLNKIHTTSGVVVT